MSLTVTYTAYSESSADEVWNVLADINSWPNWDIGLESTNSNGPTKAGASYTLKPHGGHEITATITTADGSTFSDVAKLEFGEIETVRTVQPTKGGCIVTQTMTANIDPSASRTFSNVFWGDWSQGIIDSTKALATAPARSTFVSRHQNVA